MGKEKKKTEMSSVDLIKEAVRLRDKEHKKIHTIAGILGVNEKALIVTMAKFDNLVKKMD
jgi:hypothetical protein